MPQLVLPGSKRRLWVLSKSCSRTWTFPRPRNTFNDFNFGMRTRGKIIRSLLNDSLFSFLFFFFCLVICSFPVTLHPPFTYPHTHTHTCVGCVGPYNTVNFWPLSFRLTGQWSARAYACATDHLQETDWHPQWLPTLWTPLGERGLSGWEALRLCVSACVCVCTLRLLWCGVLVCVRHWQM